MTAAIITLEGPAATALTQAFGIEPGHGALDETDGGAA